MTEVPTSEHPIAPSPELFAEWLAEAKRLHPGESTGFIAGEIARLAYRSGADQELEACCLLLDELPYDGPMLHASRRPKSLSLREQALDLLDKAEDPSWDINDFTIVRRALEQLPE